MITHGNEIKLFSGNSNRPLAEAIADKLNTELGGIEVSSFSDGEISIHIEETVRGRDLFIIQSTCTPVNDNLMELLIMIDAAKRASAGRITAVIPYFGYARQDRKARPRQPITSKLVASLLETAGANRVITMELHATQIQGFFDIPADDISAISIIGKYFQKKDLGEIVVVSPDHGGVTRARRLAEILHAPIAIIDKRRPKPNVAEAMNLIGEVDGKTAIIVDDIVDTAGTLVSGIQMLRDKGAKAIYASCVHGVLSGPAIDRLKAADLAGFICTNTIDQTEKEKLYDKMTVLSVGPILGGVIRAMEEDRPVSEVLSVFAK